MKIKAKLKKLSDVLIDLAKVIVITFVIGHFISPDVINARTAFYASIIGITILTVGIIMIPEEKEKNK